MTLRFKTALSVFAVILSFVAAAQQETEVYIPIGESPGVSGEQSIIGSISQIAYDERRMTISTGTDMRTVTMSPKTRYYIDRSNVEGQNELGSYEYCEAGMRVEVYVDDDGEAIWVKVQPGD